MSSKNTYIVCYTDVDFSHQTQRVEGHGIMQAMHTFFDEYTPVHEVMTVTKVLSKEMKK